MYIEPNSQVRLLSGVPLDDTYDHTIYFADATSQYNYFSGKVKQSFNNVSYARAERGVIRLEGTADDYYDCNYIMFQNTSFGSKWFYAFIKKAPEYVSNNVFRVEFEIDDMQTWMFDYTVDACFVEREHSVTDNIGENLLPENVDLGEYTCEGSYSLFNATGDLPLDKIVVFTAVHDDTTSSIPVIGTGFTPPPTPPTTVEPASGAVIDGVYQGLRALSFTADDGQPEFRGGVYDLNQFLMNMTEENRADEIVAIVMCPAYFFGSDSTYSNSLATERGSTLDGYTPRNKKLFTYPYNFLTLSDGNGQQIVLRYEYFEGENLELYLDKILSCTPAISVTPKNYKKNNMHHKLVDLNLPDGDMDNTITFNQFPKCSYTIDGFRAYIAQATPQLASGLASFGTSVGTSLVGASMGAVGVPSLGISSVASTIVSALIAPNKVGGNVNASDTRYQRTLANIYKGRTCICAQFARVIDDYFDRYGYSTCRNKVPNTHSRPHWNYVKTRNCTITGSIPTDSAKRICSIYNNGVTFWKNGNEVGNYSLNNSVA